MEKKNAKNNNTKSNKETNTNNHQIKISKNMGAWLTSMQQLFWLNWIRKTTDFICRQASTDRKTEGNTTQNDKHKKEKLIIDRHSIYTEAPSNSHEER